MSSRFVFITALSLLSLWLASGCLAHAEQPLSQQAFKTFPLHENPNSADISPDDTLVVTEFARLESTSDSSMEMVSDVVQLWDFHKDKLIAEKTLRKQVREKRHPPTYWQFEYVRYSGDGKFILAYLDRLLFVFSADDLQVVKKISIPGPPSETRTYKSKNSVETFTVDANVRLLEISPVRPEIALVWTREFTDSWIDLLDFEAATEKIWNSRDRGLGGFAPTAISWADDGKHLVVAVPNAWPCHGPGIAPDVFFVNPATGEIENKLSTGLIVGDIAVTADDRVFAVDRGCVGVIVNHDPKMKVFDLHTGGNVHELSGRGTGVRYEVSLSRKGDRVTAYTGIVKAGFDWGDMVPFDKHIDQTFSVWNLSNYALLFTSQNLADPSAGKFRWAGMIPLRMSPRGGYVLQGGTLYQLP